MPWISAGASIGSSIIGGVFGSRSAKKAAKAQQRATQEGLRINQGVYDEAKTLYQPTRDIGANALSRLAGQADEFSRPITNEQVMAEPGYQFGLTEGQKGIEGSAAARGGLYSGANLKALQRFGTDYATTKFNDAYNRLRTDRNDSTTRFNTLAGYGERATDRIGQAGQNYGNNAMGLITGQGNANAASKIAQGNAWQNAFNQGASALGGINWGASGVGSPKPTTGDFSRMDRGMGYADGGRVEPKVGTMGPRREPKGGSPAKQAIIDAIMEEERRKRENVKSGVGALPGDPLRNPRVILEEREKAAGLYSMGGRVDYGMGGKVSGPGGPREDAIPAMLSNGEHVIDVATVKHLGKGSTKKGHNLLTRLRMEAK